MLGGIAYQESQVLEQWSQLPILRDCFFLAEVQCLDQYLAHLYLLLDRVEQNPKRVDEFLEETVIEYIPLKSLFWMVYHYEVVEIQALQGEFDLLQLNYLLGQFEILWLFVLGCRFDYNFEQQLLLIQLPLCAYHLVLSNQSIELELVDIAIYQHIVQQVDQITSAYYLLIDLFQPRIQKSEYFVGNYSVPDLAVVGAVDEVVDELVDAVGQGVGGGDYG